MQTLLECCCGVDVHKDKLEVCILKGKGKRPETIRAQFRTKQKNLLASVTWLYENECFHVAMESTRQGKLGRKKAIIAVARKI